MSNNDAVENNDMKSVEIDIKPIYDYEYSLLLKKKYDDLEYEKTILETKLHTLEETSKYDIEQLNVKYLNAKNELKNCKSAYNDIKSMWDVHSDKIKHSIDTLKGYLYFFIGTTIGCLGYIIYSNFIIDK